MPTQTTGHSLYDVVVVFLLTLPPLVAAISSLRNGKKLKQNHVDHQAIKDQVKVDHEAIKKQIRDVTFGN